MVTSTSYYFKNDGAKKVRKTAVLLDFMTKGGASHPVWYDEIVKWQVFSGGSIEGEVRMKVLGAKRRHGENDNNNSIPLETGNNDRMDFDLQKRGDKTDIVDHDLDTSSSPPSLE